MRRRLQDAEAFLSVVFLVLIALIARTLYSKGFLVAFLYVSWSVGIIASTILIFLIVQYVLEKSRLR